MFNNFKATCLFATLLTSGLLISPFASANPWSWMTETAIGQFTPEDIDMLRKTGRDALN